MSTPAKDLSTTQSQTPSAYGASEMIYFEGRFVPQAEAKISVKTHGFLYGTSIFEGIRGYYLPQEQTISVFRMREHYERLLKNARLFYLTPEALGLDLAKMMGITVELIERCKPTTDIYIRPTLYKCEEHITPALAGRPTQFTVWTTPMGQYLDLNKGLDVCVSSWRRLSDNALPPRAKAGGAYMSTAMAVTDARQNGFDDAVFLTEEGMVSEGSAMNLFLVMNGKLVTPSAQQRILPGITRNCLMALAKNELGIETEERPVERTELYFADEAFFCGTGAQVSPITSVDRRPVGNGQRGSITEKLQTLYFDVVKNKMAKYSDWCTLVKV